MARRTAVGRPAAGSGARAPLPPVTALAAELTALSSIDGQEHAQIHDRSSHTGDAVANDGTIVRVAHKDACIV